ncbi:hypothetical protein PAXRUDRAFT_152784 [Paxillus rubicundulus Ve08.2h10]|uniref:Unplaced genomic scaffold scaffold_748, whole genome shotgun sequence n=1 Tax=Paxillus rubicundulus Ve08.2h10 TaxID=930991 RepID=A0A0D0CPY8_9AGAM|nr:hypothetical protein PAXRUDRAFT_152784 [Paxillus rubicundulus Ve08.2h10]
MSSCAKVATHNAPSSSRQPRPNPALLTTDEEPVTVSEVDDAAKVTVISGDFKDGPTTHTSETVIGDEAEVDLAIPGKRVPRGGFSRRLQEAVLEVSYLWQLTKQCLLHPGVARGLVGLVNVGLLSGAGYVLYTKPHLRGDKTAIDGALLLLGAEAYAVEKYGATSCGQEEERQARDEGTLVHQRIREQILRPGVLGNIVGLINTGIIGLVGYFSYINWDKPKWDRNIVVAASVGLLTLWRGER